MSFFKSAIYATGYSNLKNSPSRLYPDSVGAWRPLRDPSPKPHATSAMFAKVCSHLKNNPWRLYPDSVGAWRRLRESSAFTLVELMAVIGIIALLAVVGVPAIKGLTGSGGRKQALGQILGALEVARNTAISTGTNAAVIFPDQNFTNAPYRYCSMAVISWDPTNAIGTNKMVGPWITLPQGVVLHDKQINQLPILTNDTALLIPPSIKTTTSTSLRAVVFQSDGAIDDSYYDKSITDDGIAFYEGAVVNNFTTTANTSKQTNNVETIKITHYTGRPRPTLDKPK